MRILTGFMTSVILTLSACGNDREPISNSTKEQKMEETKIILTIGTRELNGHLNTSKSAQSFKSKLPLTNSMTLWSMGAEKDYCGESIDIDYDPSEVHDGFKNGDIVYYVENGANELVIFVSGEEDSDKFKGNITLGHIDEPCKVLESLPKHINVRFAIK